MRYRHLPSRRAFIGALAAATLLSGLLPWSAASPATAASTASSDYLIVSRSKLASLPTTGAPWKSMKAVADADLGTPDLSDQDNKHAGRTVAAALVFARTGQTVYRDKVNAELRELTQSPKLSAARVLSVSRQLGGYAIAADLVGYRAPAFVALVADLRTRHIGNHGRFVNVTQTSENTSSNWGAWALASRIAVSRYVGDTADVSRAAKVFRGFTGERDAYSGWQKTADFDPTWACGGSAWVPINPASCGARGGALVEDISRSAGVYPAVDDKGRTYSWEVLGGATMSATLLRHGGHPDVDKWGDRGLLRAAQFLARNGGYAPLYSTNQYIPWVINQTYGVALGPVQPAGLGRQFGFTDWLVESAPASPLPPSDQPLPPQEPVIVPSTGLIPPSMDVCWNLSGEQSRMPDGMNYDSEGRCVTIGV